MNAILTGDLPALVLALGGALGALARAYFTGEQTTWGKGTIRDVVVGAVIGFVWTVPIAGVWPPFDLPAASLAKQAVLMGFICYACADSIANLALARVPALLAKMKKE